LEVGGGGEEEGDVVWITERIYIVDYESSEFREGWYQDGGPGYSLRGLAEGEGCEVRALCYALVNRLHGLRA